MLLVNRNSVVELKPSDSNEIEYSPIPESESWIIQTVNEITDIKFGSMTLCDFPHEELEEILDSLCTA